MISLFICELLQNNQYLLDRKISSLTQTHKNLFILFILFLCLTYNKLQIIFNVLFIFNLLFLGFVKNTNIPLSNTLFLIHPILLYMSFIWVIIQIFNKRHLFIYLSLSFSFVAILLGGLWAIQELSWGGWWNWDLLECGILYIWIFATVSIHLKVRNSMTFNCNWSLTILLLCLLYGFLNKFGVAVSIHAFIASQNGRKFYYLISFILIIFFYGVFLKKNNFRLFLTITLVTMYFGLRSCLFLKPVLLLVIIFFLKTIFLKTIFLKISHKFIKYLVFILTLFNFFNQSILYTHIVFLNFSSIKIIKSYLTVKLSTFDTNVLYIWSKMWLSKPTYTLKYFFEATMSRSLYNKIVFLNFFK